MRKSVGQAPTAGEQTEQKTVSDVFRHRSGTGKSDFRMRFDVGSKRVNSPSARIQNLKFYLKYAGYDREMD
jgi:hypothetical protein